MNYVIAAIFVLLVGMTIFSGVKYLISFNKNRSKNFEEKRGSLKSINFGYTMDDEEVYSASSTDIGV